MPISLKEKLAKLSTPSDDPFSNPFDDTPVQPTPNFEDFELVLEKIEKKTKSKKKQKDYDKANRALQKIHELTERYDWNRAATFDSFIEDELTDLEDVDYRNSLLSLGRKYSRENLVTDVNSEVSKAYATSEKRLRKLIDEVDTDKSNIQSDIDDMRRMRTKNFRTLSELIQAKATYYNIELGAIREANSTVKSQFDISYKKQQAAAGNPVVDENSGTTANVIQQIFRMGRGTFIGGLGETAYGAPGSEYDGPNSYVIDDSVDDDEIERRFFSSDGKSGVDSEDTDMKLVKYENDGVEYVLTHDEQDDTYVVTAENKYGEIVEDYPMPSDIDDLNFDLNEKNGYATDNLYRKYKLRVVNKREDDVDIF